MVLDANLKHLREVGGFEVLVQMRDAVIQAERYREIDRDEQEENGNWHLRKACWTARRSSGENRIHRLRTCLTPKKTANAEDANDGPRHDY